MAERIYSYRLFGLAIVSERPLPELGECVGIGRPDVSIQWGAVAVTGDEPTGLSVRGPDALLRIADVARFMMLDGRRIVVDTDPGASDRNVRLFLLGSAFAAILHQRRLLPLHANAVVLNGRAIGFMGRPGAGKSTLAAWFHDSGFDVLADDVCVVTWDELGRPIAHSGIPRLRLWREALEASGRAADSFEAAFDGTEKYNVPTDRAGGRDPVPLDHLYVLAEPGEASEASFTPLAGAAAVEALVANTYRGAYLPLMGGEGPHLMACARLARDVPVFEAVRPWGLAKMEESSRALEAHARALLGAGG